MLGGVSPAQVRRIVQEARSAGRSPLPPADDPALPDRAMRIAEAQGLRDRLVRELTPAKPIEALPYSRLRALLKTGSREGYEALFYDRSNQMELAALACWLGMDYRDYLHDLLWAQCEATSWVMPCHAGPGDPIDLWAAMMARWLASIVTWLDGQIDPEVRVRVAEEVRRRVLDEFLNPQATCWWKTCTNNWNAVCHAGVAIAAMVLEKDQERLTRILTETLAGLEAFLEGFTADGGCGEGPSYWAYGVGWYADLAACLYDFTGGEVNIMAGPRVERICRYPLAAWVRPGQVLAFADADHCDVGLTTAININRFHAVPELFGLCRLNADGSAPVGTLDELLRYDGVKYRPLDDHADYHLPELHQVIIRTGAVTVGAKAGHNGVSHNHNDVGSFVVHRGRTFFLCDPGRPIYSGTTFSDRRYESVFCNSIGHSVPVIDGRPQQPGQQFGGTLEIEGLNRPGGKTIRIEMAGAYDVPALKRLTRVVTLSPDGRHVRIADTFAFTGEPALVKEAFLTACPAEVSEGGASVTIRSEADGAVRLGCERTAGKFSVDELTEESAESAAGELLRRIAFRPEALESNMTLSFSLDLS